MNLVSWLFGMGALLFSVGAGIYFTRFASFGLWMSFCGAVVVLLAIAIQLQQRLPRSQEQPPPFVFLKSISMASGQAIGYVQDMQNGALVLIPTLTGQPMVFVGVQSVDHSAFDVDMAAGFLIAAIVPTERPTINPPDAPTPGAVLAKQDNALLRAI